MPQRPTLSRLFEASASLENEAAVARIAAQCLWEACPRGLGLAYTIRGHPARSLGVAVGVRGEADAAGVDVERFRRVFERATLYFDRYQVDRRQRGRWVDLPAEWFRGSAFYPLFRPFGTMGRNVVCLGARPLGCAGLLLPDRAPSLTGDEKKRLRSTAARVAVPLRVAALLAQAGPSLDAVDHLMESRTDAAFLLAGDARLLASSTAGQRALDSWPSLADFCAEAVRRARTGAQTFVASGLGLEIHVTPCSRRGASAAYIAIVAPDHEPGRARLTPRQAELLERLALGLTNAEIAASLGVAPATVKTMLERLYRRAGVTGRVALLRWARG
jgi:DNA-binding NarL/FixJ family response regulator